MLCIGLLIRPSETDSAHLDIDWEFSIVNLETHDKVFEKIAKCESGNIGDAQNSESSAGGRFQFIDGTWEMYGKKYWGEQFQYKNKYDYVDNTELAWYVYTNYGTGDWDASKHCWQ